MLNPRTGRVQACRICFQCLGPQPGVCSRRKATPDPDGIDGYGANARRQLEDCAD